LRLDGKNSSDTALCEMHDLLREENALTGRNCEREMGR
jgi:hypothetical protein